MDVKVIVSIISLIILFMFTFVFVSIGNINTLQTVTDLGATTTNDITIGSNTTSASLNITAPSLYTIFHPELFFDSANANFKASLNGEVSATTGGATAIGSFFTNKNYVPSSDTFKVIANGDSSVAISGQAMTRRAIAIGDGTRVETDGGIGIGVANFVNGSDISVAIGTNLEQSYANSLLFGFGDSIRFKSTKDEEILFGYSNSDYLLQLSKNEGVRVGNVTGESITMTGDDLYVYDNTQIGGFMVVGNNTENGLSEGDINASTIYYDTLTAKSPVFLCEQKTNWCEITLPQYQESLFVDFSSSWDVENVRFRNVDYTPSEFKNTVCASTQRITEICDEIIKKYQKLKAKYENELNLNNYISNCENNGYIYVNKKCYEETTTQVTYSNAVETFTFPIYDYVYINVTVLDANLEEVQVEKKVKASYIGLDTKYKFKNNCNWDEVLGYYCLDRVIVSTFS